MFVVNEDKSIYVTRGDVLFFSVSADDNGEAFVFRAGDVVRLSVYGKKDAKSVALQKDFAVTDDATSVEIFLTREDTTFGDIISKPKDYWYEVVVNPDDHPQTIIGYDEDGAKLFRLYPEAEEAAIPETNPEDIPVVDAELDVTSHRPVENQAVAKAFLGLEEGYENVRDAVAKLHVTPQMFGAIGDGIANDTDALQAALDTKAKLHVPNGVYKVTRPLVAYNSIFFEKDACIEFYPAANGDTCIKVSGSLTKLVSETQNYLIEGTTLNVGGGLPGVEKGDYLYLSNDEFPSPHCRSFDTQRDIVQLAGIDDYGGYVLASAPAYEYDSAYPMTVSKMNTVDNIVIDGAKIKCMARVGNSCGITLEYARNATVRNCHISGFDYGQINLNFCVFCDAHSNFCEVDYADSLQYGIVVHSSANVAVYGNKVNSRRTAIDVTRLSNNVSVNGNTVVGHINTHSCTNTSITNNTINDGMILIRGRDTIVTGNTVQCLDVYCIDIEEMGIDGGHIISNNVFRGYCSMKCYFSNITITNNHFIVEKVLSYGDGAYESVIRFMTASDKVDDHMEGAIVAGNTFEAVGITPKYCIESNLNATTIYNLIIRDNVIRGFDTALYLPQMSTNIGKNLIVKNNMLFVESTGIVFRLVNNTQIVGNTITSRLGGTAGIVRHPIADVTTVGLIIRDNFVQNFSYGIQIQGGADMKNAVVMDNVLENCATKTTGVSGNTSRVGNELFASSVGGKTFYLRLTDDGTLTPTLMDY